MIFICDGCEKKVESPPEGDIFAAPAGWRISAAAGGEMLHACSPECARRITEALRRARAS